MFFHRITYSILRIIFAEFFCIHQDLIQRPEISNLEEAELTNLLENVPLTMDLLELDLDVGRAEVKNSARLKNSLGLIWMHLFHVKDNFEFLIKDIDSVTLNYFNLVEFQSFISGERYDSNFLTLAEKIFFEYLEECNPHN